MFPLVVGRDPALRPAERRFAFGVIAAVSLAIALGFAWVGAWMILPFAGAEIAALYLAYRWIEQHADDYERVAVEGDVLVVESRERDRVRRFEFNRHWAQVALVRTAGQCRVTVRSHGRQVEFGRLLSEEQCREAAAGLTRELRALR